MTDSGHFNVTERNRIELKFGFKPQNLDQVKFFKAAHLWLFPIADNGTKDAKTLEIGLLVAITTPSMKGEKRKRFSLLWNKETQHCLSVDVTIPLHKLIKQLQLRNEMTGSIIVEVTHIKKPSQAEEGGWTSDILEVCKELSGIENSTRIPFLVIDFTAEEIASGRRPRKPNQPESRVITRELSSVDMQQMYREARGISKSKNDTTEEEKPEEKPPCPVHDLEVSMSSILNTETVPDMINIGECRGSCSLSYISHSNLKTYYRQMTEKVPVANNCCIPKTFESVSFLIIHNSNSTSSSESMEIEVLPDAIIRSCMCFNIQPTTSD